MSCGVLRCCGDRIVTAAAYIADSNSGSNYYVQFNPVVRENEITMGCRHPFG